MTSIRNTPTGKGSIPIILGRIDWDWAATALATPHWHITSDGVNVGKCQFSLIKRVDGGGKILAD
jgi:hypothetical protein